MADAALDALVARRVMGWKVGGDGRFIGPGRSWRPAHAFKPSESIEAAWKVVERNAVFGLMLSLQLMKDGSARAIFSLDLDRCPRTEMAAETAQIAICLAALDANGVERADLEEWERAKAVANG